MSVRRRTTTSTRRNGSPPLVKKVHAMNYWQRCQYVLLTSLFILSIIYFWQWWLRPEHWGNSALFIIMSACMAYQFTLLPSFYAFFLGWMRHPTHLEPQKGLKVALVTLTVPGSESLEIVKRQLVAMTSVMYPHDNWILVDKVHSPEIQRIADELGVNYFCRHDTSLWGTGLVNFWNQLVPPFKTKTKAGNVNAWLHATEWLDYEYDVFTQLDIDHRPRPDYLDRVLGYFRDKKVAWVQAPSIYDNLGYWTARGSAEQELVLQGPLQSGFFGFSSTPFIIGSHCSYQMSAIREIGGFQPTRAEDHLDTVILASRGYHGVFVPDTIAVGDGPESFEMYLGQQFAWAYSMIQVLFYWTPRLFWNYTIRQAGQFLFAQTWYTIWSTSMAVLFALPCVALLTNRSISHTGYFEFMMHSAPEAIIATVIWFWSRTWFKPHNLRLSWRGVILHIARWPIVLSALIQVILRVQKPYMITRKGVDTGEERPFALVPHIPYFILFLASLGACWTYIATTSRSETQGYLLFALQGALGVLGVYITALVQDIRDLIKEVGLMRSLTLRVRQLLVGILLIVLFCSTGTSSAGRIREAIAAPTTPPAKTTVGGGLVFGALASVPSVTAVTPLPTATATPHADLTIKLPTTRAFLGVYDVWTKGFEEHQMDAELNFISWEKSQDMVQFAQEVQKKSRVPMISVEPWTTKSGDPANLLQDTLSGQNDDVIRQDAGAIKSLGSQVVIVRFAHEMELLGNYPWSTSDSELYIRFYRHYVNLFNEEGVTNVRWIWSPAGNEGCNAYYPGDKYADYVGVTVLGNKTWDLQYGDHVNSFAELFGEKYNRVVELGKPIIIPELGVAGEPEHKREWLESAYQSLQNFPQLAGIVYFNSFNSANAWKGDTPDWRITPDMLWKREEMPKR